MSKETKSMAGKEYHDYVQEGEELLAKHMQSNAPLFGDEDGDKLLIYRAEIRSDYTIVGEFDGVWAGDNYIFKAVFGESGKLDRASGEVTHELITFLEAALEKFIKDNGDRTVWYVDKNTTVERSDGGNQNP